MFRLREIVRGDMAEITVYTSEPSVVCARVKTLLDKREIPYTEVAVRTEADRKRFVEQTGRKSCPVVIVGDTLIGGLRETIAAVESGRLQTLANA
jgi:glutaredoxin